MGYTVYFVRHGEMPLNRPENHQRIIKTGIDDPLTTRGIAEAEALGRALKDTRFVKVYASTYQRARQTAEWILKNSTHQDVTVTEETRVRERNSGEWENKTPVDMYMEAVKQQTYPHFLPCPGGETVEEVMARGADFFQELCNASDKVETDESVLVASHGAFLACFLEYLIQSKDNFILENVDVKKAREPAPTTGVIKIRIGKLNEQGVRNLSFLQLHDQKHLEGVSLPE